MSLRFRWHRWVEWLSDQSALRHYAAIRRLCDRADRHSAAGQRAEARARRHGAEADRLRPPPGPDWREPPAAPPPEWDRRRADRLDDEDPASRLN